MSSPSACWWGWLTCADMVTPLVVSEAEAGQKLLAYLQRRLGTPSSCAHRWIRTGQVRINGKRCKAFDRVVAGDAVRLPPAAFADRPPMEEGRSAEPVVSKTPVGPLPPLVFSGNGVAVFNKPAGLPVQPGTGHSDSLATRLAAWYADSDFVPAPAHRLDRDTTGLLAVGCTYGALRRLQEAFAGAAPLRKEYLCWVHGDCPWNAPEVLTDRLAKSGLPGQERVRAVSAAESFTTIGPESGQAGKHACLAVRCVTTRVIAGQICSLLHITLMTGRTHQIRVQMASRGFPLVGDGKYGRPRDSSWPAGLLLHAVRLCVDGACHEVGPPWPPPWDVPSLPSSYDLER